MVMSEGARHGGRSRSWRTVRALLLSGCLLASVGLVHSSASPNAQGPPPRGTLEMTGDIGDFIPGVVDDPVHDPAVIRDGDTYYVFSTGILRNPGDPGGIFVRRSTGTLAGPWESLDEIAVPEWTREYGHNHLWAPQVVKRGNTFYLYYAASSFGRNTSAVGVASTTTPGDLDSWQDHGPVVTSQQGVHDYNAIDPHVFTAGGRWWIAFGSHWTGVKLQELASMTEPTGPVYSLADRGVPPNAVEAPTIFKRGRYYYLLTSWDRCCAGTDSTYKVAVGRSLDVTGPYLDRDGVPLLEGGGTVVLESHADQIGPGGQDVILDRGIHYLIHHYYDAGADGVIRMQVRSIDWQDGWPSFDLEQRRGASTGR
ncbi:arabinan endo-1,5-alpha-L-arabinosidase [Phytoactinopolyspora alkaliphila]|uniref:Arabinan endo-1,5-alpha-L-arabinosidase n=1 Tax=Phytoactinopolyspora alkaliphila TaxID=1783498 RepID=A0A6N9YS61_9ACTN|nr:arabinan endo-1,5-alpha-L-arabinosidase [Phytoactinopolyspora alkaliphila]NED97777.1 arabinan endo-1,5-alpha-L-arabinosidase [Phytoactinopolyspora alkaliphila]